MCVTYADGPDGKAGVSHTLIDCVRFTGPRPSFGESSNGRTVGSGPISIGSSPVSPSNLFGSGPMVGRLVLVQKVEVRFLSPEPILFKVT